MENSPLFLFVGIAAIAIGVAVYSYQAKKKRREDFALVAKQLGLEYWQVDPFGLISEPFLLFGKGDGQGIENVLAGPYQGVDAKAFDFWYYEESTDSQGHRTKTYYRFDCVIVPIDAACSPLTIDNENVFTRLADALSFHDIEFESEEFNRSFNVKGADEKFANDLIDARMIAWLLANATDCWIELVGDRVLVARRRLTPVELPGLLALAQAFTAQVPRVVADLYPLGGPPRPDR